VFFRWSQELGRRWRLPHGVQRIHLSHQQVEVPESQRLSPVALCHVGVEVNLNEQPVGPGNCGGQGHPRHQPALWLGPAKIGRRESRCITGMAATSNVNRSKPRMPLIPGLRN
jgi:hypothetical protein